MKVSLLEVQPVVWRRLRVSSHLTLHQLHQVVQAVMGWEDYHLYEFTLGHSRPEAAVIARQTSKGGRIVMTIAFEEVKREALKNPRVRAEYDALAERYAMIRRIVSARTEAGLTQQEIAERMGTTQSVIARLEGGKVSPSLDTLYKYARAVGIRPVISFEPVAEHSPAG